MPYLLDSMSKTGRETCSCAFALYRLSASYTGPTVDVYNSTNAITTTFYADIYGNLGTALNATGTLYTSIVTSTGYIIKWYDQSGSNNHATQLYTLAPSLNYTNKFVDFTTYSGLSFMNLPNNTVPQQIAYTIICKHGTINNSSGGFIGAGNNLNTQGNSVRRNGNTGYINYWVNYDDAITATVIPGNVVTFKFDGNSTASGVTYGYVNSVLITTTANSSRNGYTTGLTWNGQSGNEVLGDTPDDASLNGQMYYLLAFKSALDNDDRLTAESLTPWNKICYIPSNGPIDFLNIGAATNQLSGPIDLGTVQTNYATFGNGTNPVDLNTCLNIVNGFTPAWCMDAVNYQSGIIWKDTNTTNNYDMTVSPYAYTANFDGTPTMNFSSATTGAAKRVVGTTLTNVPFNVLGTTMICFSAIKNDVGTSSSYDWEWKTLYRVSGNVEPRHSVIIEQGINNAGTSRMGAWTGAFLSSDNDIVTGPVPIPYAYQQNNMLVHTLGSTSPYYQYKHNDPRIFTTSYNITNANSALRSGSGTGCIGNWHDNNTLPNHGSQWWGNVSAVFMYNSKLTDVQIQDLYTRFCPRFYGFNNPALGVLPITSGLVGWYTGESFSGTTWTDLSGAGNHATSSGTIQIGTFSNGPKKFLYGGTTATLLWPTAILPTIYTLFHVTRYGSQTGTTYRRILQGYTVNWLSGHWAGISGVAYHNNWLTQLEKTVHGTSWIISTDQNNLYRSNGYQRSTASGATPSYNRLAINTSTLVYDETSDFSIATVIVFNRTLTTTEMQTMEKWLNIVYNITVAPNHTPILVNPGTQTYTGSGSTYIIQKTTNTGNITWAYKPITSGISLASQTDGSTIFTVSSGTMIDTTNFTVTATNPSGVTSAIIFSVTSTVTPAFIIQPYVSAITTTSITVMWTISGSVTSFALNYKTVAEGSYSTISSASSPQIIASLATDTIYMIYGVVSYTGGTVTSSIYTQSTMGSSILYTMPTTFTFTSMNKNLFAGPTMITYTGSPGYNTTYQLALGTMSGINLGMQLWTVPQSKVYQFRVVGAGYAETVNAFKSYGADFTISLPLTKGHVISIAIGQQSSSDNATWSGGQGGTWVYNNTLSILLFVAGGSGANSTNSAGDNGQSGRNGTAGKGGGGVGGTNGNGGSAASSGNGGGGYLTNGANATGSTPGGNRPIYSGWNGGLAFVNGAQGGTGTYQTGGFGGGGCGGNNGPGQGGGGGYSGGGGANQQGAGGGGSYSLTSLTVTLNTLTNTSTGFLIIN